MAIQTSDRCCCGCCHVKTGTWILIIVQIVVLIARLAGAGSGLATGASSTTKHAQAAHGGHWNETVDLIVTIAVLVAAVLVVVALIKTMPKLMIFHIVICVIYVVWSIIAVILLFTVGGGLNGAAGGVIVSLIFCLLTIFLWLYFIWVEYSCYVWLGGQPV